MDSALVKFVILSIRNLADPNISDDQVWVTADSKGCPATIDQLDRLGMDKESAIQATCVYVEDDRLCVEGGLPDGVVETVTPHCPGLRLWPGRALSFGWTHSVIVRGADLLSFGDSQHGGTNNMSAVDRC